MPDSARPHVIRLRGPWQYEPLAAFSCSAAGHVEESTLDLPPPAVAKIPCDWGNSLGSDFRGRVRYTRGFSKPTGLEPGDQVHLVIGHVDALGRHRLNRQPWAAIDAGCPETRIDITSLLEVRNQLEIEVELPMEGPDEPRLERLGRDALPGGLVGEVRLEIYAAGVPS